MAEYQNTRLRDDSNRFRFTCPIFGTDVEVRDCFHRYARYMRGDRTDERKGCLACMAASKCPIYWIQKELRLDPHSERYYSAEEKLGRLPVKILQAAETVAVLPSQLDRFAVPDAERAAIEAATGVAVGGGRSSGINDADEDERRPARKRESRLPRKKVVKKVSRVDATVAAAVKGDMSAAITKAAEAVQSAPPAPAKSDPAPAPAAASQPPAPPNRAEAPPSKSLSLLELARRRKKS